jgi:hypothetical protein
MVEPLYWYEQLELPVSLILLDDWLTVHDERQEQLQQESSKIKESLKEIRASGTPEGILSKRQLAPLSVERLLGECYSTYRLPHCSLPLRSGLLQKIRKGSIETLVIGSISVCRYGQISIPLDLVIGLNERVGRLILAQPINIDYFCALFPYPTRCLTGVWLTGRSMRFQQLVAARNVAPNIAIVKIEIVEGFLHLHWFSNWANGYFTKLQLLGSLNLRHDQTWTNFADHLDVLDLDNCVLVRNFSFVEDLNELQHIRIRNARWFTLREAQIACSNSAMTLAELDLSNTEVLVDQFLFFLIHHKIDLVTFRANLDQSWRTRSGFSNWAMCAYVCCPWNMSLRRLELRGHHRISAFILSVDWTCWEALEVLDLRRTSCVDNEGHDYFLNYVTGQAAMSESPTSPQPRIYSSASSHCIYSAEPPNDANEFKPTKRRAKGKKAPDRCHHRAKHRRAISVHVDRAYLAVYCNQRVGSEDNLSLPDRSIELNCCCESEFQNKRINHIAK